MLYSPPWSMKSVAITAVDLSPYLYSPYDFGVKEKIYFTCTPYIPSVIFLRSSWKSYLTNTCIYISVSYLHCPLSFSSYLPTSTSPLSVIFPTSLSKSTPPMSVNILNLHSNIHTSSVRHIFHFPLNNHFYTTSKELGSSQFIGVMLTDGKHIVHSVCSGYIYIPRVNIYMLVGVDSRRIHLHTWQCELSLKPTCTILLKGSIYFIRDAIYHIPVPLDARATQLVPIVVDGQNASLMYNWCHVVWSAWQNPDNVSRNVTLAYLIICNVWTIFPLRFVGGGGQWWNLFSDNSLPTHLVFLWFSPRQQAMLVIGLCRVVLLRVF